MPEPSIGQTLKHARTAKKLSLKQVTKVIHIREEYLSAIEKDHPEELPSPVQGRGFIRLYWSYLGLEEEQLEGILHPPAPPEPEISLEEKSPLPEKKILLPDLTERFKNAVHQGFAAQQKTRPEKQEIPLTQDTPASTPRPPRPSDQVIVSIGAQLRDQRERLSLSLDNIETYTHIPAHYLKALEEGLIGQLPSPVQGRGMLNNYASFLDLDVDAILMQYADALQLRREEMEQETTPEKKKRKPPKVVKPGSVRMVFSFDVALVALLILAAFIALIWGAGSIMAFRSAADQLPTERPISDVIIGTTTTTGEVTATLTLLPETIIPSLENPVILPSEVSLTEEITATTSGTPPTQGVYTVQVFIVAIQRSYLQVIVDGKVAFNGRTIPGNPYTYNGNKQIEVISGNAAAIQITYNGTSLGTLGNTGAVIHMIFSLDNYGTPTLTPTATASETLRPSRTPKPSNTYPPTRTKTMTPTKLPSSTPKPTNTPKGTINP